MVGSDDVWLIISWWLFGGNSMKCQKSNSWYTKAATVDVQPSSIFPHWAPPTMSFSFAGKKASGTPVPGLLKNGDLKMVDKTWEKGNDHHTKFDDQEYIMMMFAYIGVFYMCWWYVWCFLIITWSQTVWTNASLWTDGLNGFAVQVPGEVCHHIPQILEPEVFSSAWRLKMGHLMFLKHKRKLKVNYSTNEILD